MKFKIQNYKSIINQEINIDKNINYFIGANESGKSNFLDAIKEIENTNIKIKNFNFNSNKEIGAKIEYYWKLNGKIQKKWEKIGYKREILMKRYIDKEANFYLTNFDENLNNFIYKKLKNNYDIKEKEIENIFSYNKISGLNLLENKNDLEIKNTISILIEESRFLNNSIEIIPFKEFGLLEREYTFDEANDSPIFLGLWELLEQDPNDIQLLNELDKNSDDFINLKDKIEKNLNKEFDNIISSFWKQKTIKFDIKIEQSGFIIRAADEFLDNKNYNYKNLNYRSDGMKHYLSLIIFINYVRQKNKDKKKIILLDEPDKNLHALAVLDLKNYLEKISNENKNLKFIIATHNPYFIDENNFHEISFVTKEKKEEGSIIIKNFAKLSNKEDRTTLQPFLTKMGLDVKAFIELANSKIVFVEGFHDFILLYSACKQLEKNQEYQKLIKKITFIPLGSSTKMPSVVNLSISFNRELPFFIFDHDEGGNKGYFKYKNNGFIKNNNFIFINKFNEYKPKEGNVETQDIFDDTSYENENIYKDKNTKKYIKFAKEIRENKIQLGKNTKNNLKKVLNKIKKHFNL